ncbi:Hypothetical protein, putative [Bodo saltans]|uniref:Uncharacterized protein n=1 Tax=Bodo saltans TaxID=75058 RepID=A0A0S4J688_BODSA|nr:Hypothetical protein, putative [Bodo saltans]|eukprot:CUG68076.1 Hypothetical protein, putative [Bodo saltans]
MSNEREIVTVALGNYSALVAAQWANGLSLFDMERDTLSLTSRHSVVATSGFGQNASATSRVARLVILDNHHSSRIVKDIPIGKEETDAAVRAAMGSNQEGGDDDDREEEEDTDVAFDDFSYITTTVDFTTNGLGAPFVASQYTDPNRGNDDDATDNHHDNDEGRGDETEEDIASRLAQRDKTNAKAIFRHKDAFVPWHHFIRAGLHERSYIALADAHRESGGLSLLHSAGYGKSHMRSSNVPEVDATFDAVRYMLEGSDHPQGCQFFVDGDSCFSGLGANLLHELRESWGSKMGLFTMAAYEPFPQLNLIDDDFARIRLDEVDLNFALSIVHLSEASSVFVPCRVSEWEAFQAEAARHKAPALPYIPSTLENTSTAQILATAWDTATFGLRGGAGTGGDAPQLSMGELERFIRPSEGYRIASLYSATPYRVPHTVSDNGKRLPSSFWGALQANSLFPVSGSPNTDDTLTASSSFFPLSHSNKFGPDRDAGRILGHSLTVRGIKGLMDDVYPRQEAILRHVYPLRTATVSTTFTDNGYPVSDTFPSNVLFPPRAPGAAAIPLDGITDVPVAAHLCCTYNAGGMIAEAAKKFDVIRKYRRHTHKHSYEMEDDEWAETSESLHQLSDDYCHQDEEEDGTFCDNE